MLKSDDPAVIIQGIHCAGEIRLQCRRILHKYTQSRNQDIRIVAAKSLVHLGDMSGFNIILDNIANCSEKEFNELKHFVESLETKSYQLFEHALVQAVAHEFASMSKRYGGKKIETLNANVLQKLRRLYILLDEFEELFAVENAIEKGGMIIDPAS